MVGQSLWLWLEHSIPVTETLRQCNNGNYISRKTWPASVFVQIQASKANLKQRCSNSAKRLTSLVNRLLIQISTHIHLIYSTCSALSEFGCGLHIGKLHKGTYETQLHTSWPDLAVVANAFPPQGFTNNVIIAWGLTVCSHWVQLKSFIHFICVNLNARIFCFYSLHSRE